MLKVENVKVYDLKESVIASGNAMRTSLPQYTDEEFKKGIERMKKLVKASDNSLVHCHKNALCGIRVSFDIVYPCIWTPEAQRYKFMDIVTSASKMHRLHQMEVRKVCDKYTDPRCIAILEEKIAIYKEKKSDPNATENEIYVAMREMFSSCPMGLELFERISTNYLSLANVYHQRKYHKLKEWHNFCRFIEELPYFQELILGQDYDPDYKFITDLDLD